LVQGTSPVFLTRCLRSRGDLMRVDDRVRSCIELIGDLVIRNDPLGPRTTYRVGGPAALFVEIVDEESLERVAGAVQASGIEVLVIGNGSNLLVADAGFSGLVVHLGGVYDDLVIDEELGLIGAGGAVAYPVLARRSVASGVGGLEWAVGIPGSVGGAVAMNAGGHGSETESNLIRARVVDLNQASDGWYGPADLVCAYRSTNVGCNQIVLEARLHGVPGEAQAELLEEIVKWRRLHQPGGRNCGSVFTNPAGDSAGRFIEAAGLKGLRLGSAQVSAKHANFIQVDSSGSADDVKALIDLVREKVARAAGVELVTELRMVGFGS